MTETSRKNTNNLLKQYIATTSALGLTAILGASSARSAVQSDDWYVVLGRCGESEEGVLASKVNRPESTPICLSPKNGATSADVATHSAVLDLGNLGGTELIRIEAKKLPAASVKQIFTVVAPPANPLDMSVDRLQFFQAAASSCAGNANFSFTTVNDSSPVQRGWGERDVRINPVYELPAEWTTERLRHEILFEQAAFRGIVERPTFDILHPFAERPLLVTVFDLLPVVKSTERCR